MTRCYSDRLGARFMDDVSTEYLPKNYLPSKSYKEDDSLLLAFKARVDLDKMRDDWQFTVDDVMPMTYGVAIRVTVEARQGDDE